MDKFLKRILARETSIRDWLSANGHDTICLATEQLLENQNQASLAERFEDGVNKALTYCTNNPLITALDFSWYYAGRETGEALAYGYAGIKSKGTLAKSDLGPEEISGVEIKSTPGDVLSEHFAGLPTHIALNAFVSDIKPMTENSPADVVVLATDLVNLWNYQRVFEAVSTCLASKQYPLSANFWVTLTRHERGSVPITQILINHRTTSL